jgi:hypothetical protein
MTEGEFKWQRPKLMGMTDFKEFVSEVESRVGVENTELLKDINIAINTDESYPYYLEMTKEDVDKLLLSSNLPKDKFLSYLSFLYEIEYRKKNGPALWERKNSVIPCPNYLLPTKWQMRSNDISIFNKLNKLWNISLVIVITGAIPFMVVPLSKFIYLGTCEGPLQNTGNSLFSIIVFFIWLSSIVLFSIAFLCSRYLRNKRYL